MLFSFQRTIKSAIGGFGVGVHSGKSVSIKLLPAAENTGVVFKRTDIADQQHCLIPANYSAVCNTMLGTTITNSHGVKVATIEHLMAALWGCGIDNVIIELDAQEVPIMDGSSEPFVFMLECAGVQEQSVPRRVIEVLKAVEITEGDAYASIKPAQHFKVSMEIEFNNNTIAKQQYMFNSDLSFKMDLCRARTFGFIEEVAKLKEMGLARGGSLDNAVVLDGDEVLNEGGLRFKDEFVRHKVLDLIGDTYLAGVFIKGHLHGVKSGHSMNNKLLRKFFADDQAWRLMQFNAPQPTHRN